MTDVCDSVPVLLVFCVLQQILRTVLKDITKFMRNSWAVHMPAMAMGVTLIGLACVI